MPSELINTSRDECGQVDDVVDIGKSLVQDRKRKPSGWCRPAKAGRGDPSRERAASVR